MHLLKSLHSINQVAELGSCDDFHDHALVIEVCPLVGDIAILAWKVIIDDTGERTIAIIDDPLEL